MKPLLYASEALVHFLLCFPFRPQSWLPWEIFVVISASVILLFNEYRLTKMGLVWGLVGIFLMGVSRAFLKIAAEVGSIPDMQAEPEFFHRYILLTGIFGLLFSGSSAYFWEHIEQFYSVSLETIGLMAINIASIVVTTFMGTTLLAYSPIYLSDNTLGFTDIPISMLECVTSSTSSLLVLLAAILTSPLVIISWIQIAAYQIATILLLGEPQIYLIIVRAVDFTQEQIHSILKLPLSTDPSKPGRTLTSAVLLVLIAIIAGIVSLISSLSISLLPPPLPTSLDNVYRPSSRFDIVVSMYNESPASVKEILDSIKNTTPLSNLSPNIIIYVKDSHANIGAIQAATGATNVTIIDNLGREGGTFLHHIVSNWETLAEQTMFLQALPHDPEQVIPRIESYLVPSSGMLSLGHTGISCDCQNCEDRWDWSDSFSTVPYLYSKVYGQTCKPGTPILLAYNGQFVASARRIRGVDREIYQELLQAITSKEGWSHDKAAFGNSLDTPDSPIWGYTMERVWGLLLQCATDAAMAARCPSMLSGMAKGGDVQDCQCLDDNDGSW
jgi:hypothetical protein